MARCFWRQRFWGFAFAPSSILQLPAVLANSANDLRRSLCCRWPNLSGDPAQDYFSDGLTDELITEGGEDRRASASSRVHRACNIKGSHKSLPVIAKELGVDALVEGSVVRFGRPGARDGQLIDARDDRHIWSESYESNVVDVLTLQSEVAQTIADQAQGEINKRATCEPRTSHTESMPSRLKLI